MPPASNKPHSAGKYSGLASNLAHLDRIRLSPGQGAAARWQMMLPAESGTLPHRPWTPMSLVNGRSPQAKRCGRDEAKRKSVRKRLPLRGSRCVGDSPRKPLRHHREATAGRETARLHREAASQRKARRHRYEQPAEPSASRCASCRTSTIGKQLHSAKQGTFGRSNLPNQQHREEHFLSNNGAKRAGAERVRGSNLACFLKNFVSNYIVIFLMMLFRVHL